MLCCQCFNDVLLKSFSVLDLMIGTIAHDSAARKNRFFILTLYLHMYDRKKIDFIKLFFKKIC